MEPLGAGDPSQIGAYVLLSRLGAGGMGRVYLARSPGRRLVAVKVVREEFADDPGFRERFRREVTAARAVGGFWTASVVDADTEGPAPWLATEYVPGPSLAQAVAESGPLPEHAVPVLAAGLAEGLIAIHAAGLVHRDLKPSNVLLAADGPRVIDFGISRATEGTGLTATGRVFGTPGFLSPEQALGTRIGPASDVFSLGAVLAFAVTGRAPFGDGNSFALLNRVIQADPDLDGVPRPLAVIIGRCLAKDPGARPTPRRLLAEFGEPGQPVAENRRGWLPPAVDRMARTYLRSTPHTPASGAARARQDGAPGSGAPSQWRPAQPASGPPQPPHQRYPQEAPGAAGWDGPGAGGVAPGSGPWTSPSPGGAHGFGHVPQPPPYGAGPVLSRRFPTVVALAGVAVLIAAIGAAAVVVGGGPSGTPETTATTPVSVTREQFISQADGVCGRYLARARQQLDPTAVADPAGYLAAMAALNKLLVKDLRAIERPQADREQLESLFSESDAMIAQQERTAAALRSNPYQATQALVSLQGTESQMKADAARYGFKVCSQ